MSIQFSRIHWRSAGLSAALIVLIGCAVSPQQEQQIGAENAKMVETQIGVERSHPLADYVSQVGQRLVAQLDQPEFTYHFAILDDPTPNAFALPGGYIFISRGLLAIMNSEDELAGVLAHEIIHVSEHHSIKQMRSSILPSLVELPGNIVGGVVSEDLGALINTPISAGNSLISAKYSRTHESESDSLGIALAAKAGYQPSAMADILKRMNDVVELELEQEIEKSYFDSHPYTPERVAAIQKQVPEISVTSSAPVQPSMLNQLDGLLYGPNPAKGVFKQQVFLHPDLDFTIDFPAQWHTMNQPQVVAAANKQQTALIGMTMADPQFTAADHAAKFQGMLQQRYGYDAQIDTHKYAWGGQSYSVSLPTEVKGVASTIQQQWLSYGEHVYQMFGYAPNTQLDLVDSTMKSFAPLTDKARSSITSLHIKTVSPNGSAAALMKQSSPAVKPEMLLILNGVTNQEALSQLPQVKILEEKVWQKPQ
ncbi:M48 family metalloprotease [Motilimonas pumila]|uniref:Peptidase n=1 Tax=Motilimonas pumila TaxID=2303987 RepID=A0A418YIX6_9GAMM|nr:M48 family metalloprotease [Motilimonas pumila]RJG50569.1 peptidase [Motilimonas pumila]